MAKTPRFREGHVLFNRIAHVYGWFFHHQRRAFQRILQEAAHSVDFSDIRTILDIGCGTGALCSVLQERGYEVIGTDPAQRMLEEARRRPENRHVQFVEGDAVAGLPFEDNHFDLVIASHVAHGLPPGSRQKLYAEMVRVASKKVILHDYNQVRHLPTSFIEWLERGDYFRFIHVVQDELQDHFGNLQVVPVAKRAAWYVCEL